MAQNKMNTWHIHITGLVQGVGFRPHVYRLAQQMNIPGQVSNTPDGVHILFNASWENADRFYSELIRHPPASARILYHHLAPSRDRQFNAFAITASAQFGTTDLLPAPDIACCDRCRAEIKDPANRRYRYPFTTCVDCGPRYSILEKIPYDRAHTTMAPFTMCESCEAEYNNPGDRRFYSQTSSCGECAIPLKLYDNLGSLITSDPSTIYSKIWTLFSDGAIIAVKGMGGYLLLCDAYNEDAVKDLRARKHRPEKPFAVLYKDITAIRQDLDISEAQAEALTGPVGPIVLADLKPDPQGGTFKDWIAPGLDTIGAMLPSTPLLQLIANDYGIPLVATSANISGSPIIYRDEDALTDLNSLADYTLVYERAIITPQDDSVLQFTDKDLLIILRRSRGLAPNYFPNPFQTTNIPTIGFGAEMKATFALQDGDRLYVSQNLGDWASLDAQEAYLGTLDHWRGLLNISPGRILIDLHPGYSSSRVGAQLAEDTGAVLYKVQHHKAHFAAVLAENELLHSRTPVLGFIWDGAGYGEDGNIWGGETFLLDERKFTRVGHWDYFPQLPGDSMSREPRLSALSLLNFLPDRRNLLLQQLSKQQVQFYSRWFGKQADEDPNRLSAAPGIQTSSVGRLLDGIAWLLGITERNTYEGEAALKLQHLAQRCSKHELDPYPITISDKTYSWQPMLQNMLDDLQNGIDRACIARKVFETLAATIEAVAGRHNVDKLALSGGVFQNRLLVQTIIRRLKNSRQLYFHRQLSPNDECIGFGQIAYYNLLT